MDRRGYAWEISRMAKNDVPPGISAQLDRLLTEARPANMSERQFCIQSSVSTSFFTDLRNGREPSIDRVERLANTAGLRLSELVEGAEPPVQPTVVQLEQMIAEIIEAEVSFQTKLSDLPHIVATGLHEQLEHFQSGLSSPKAGGASTVPGRAVRSRVAKNEDAPEELHTT